MKESSFLFDLMRVKGELFLLVQWTTFFSMPSVIEINWLPFSFYIPILVDNGWGQNSIHPKAEFHIQSSQTYGRTVGLTEKVIYFEVEVKLTEVNRNETRNKGKRTLFDYLFTHLHLHSFLFFFFGFI